jgi:hypothetical protein
METRATVRRAEDQRRAAEEMTQEWLRRQVYRASNVTVCCLLVSYYCKHVPCY